MSEGIEKTLSLASNSEAETLKFAQEYAKGFKEHPNKVICLKGCLGAGKTTFVKGFTEALGVSPKRVKSPTYTYLRQYSGQSSPIYHFDYYRLENSDEVLSEELLEIINKKDSTVLIEWPEKVEHLLPKERIEINITPGKERTQRNISLKQLI